jgi:hypothetical protein
MKRSWPGSSECFIGWAIAAALCGYAGTTVQIGPSMRRPVDVKAHFRFLLSVSLFPFSQAAPVAILPFALFYERYSLGASWVFSFQ